MQRDLGSGPPVKNQLDDNHNSSTSRTPSLRARAAIGSVDVLSKFGRSPSRRRARPKSDSTPVDAAARPFTSPSAESAAGGKESTAGLATMSSVDNITGVFYEGPRHASSASTLYQHIHDMSNKRIATLNYMRRVHQGHSCWFNSVHFSHADISRLPSYSASRLSRRATNYMLLGMSIPAVLDVYPPPHPQHPQHRPAAHASLAAEYLRALHALLTEFEAFQQLHPADGSSTSSLARARIPHMFKRSVSGRPRKSSSTPVADIGAPLPQTAGLAASLADAPSQAASFDSSSSYSNASFSSSTTTLVAPAPLVAATPSAGHATFPPPAPADAPNSLLLPNEGPYSHLLTPPLPFTPDFFAVFSTLCDVLIDAYQRLQQLLCSPAICTPALSDSFSKVDARLRKVIRQPANAPANAPARALATAPATAPPRAPARAPATAPATAPASRSSSSLLTSVRARTESAIARSRHSPLRGDLSDEDLLAVTNARLSRIIDKNSDVERDGVVVLKGTRTPPATPESAKEADGRGKDVRPDSDSDKAVVDDSDHSNVEEIAIAGRKTMDKPKYPKTPPASSDGSADSSSEDDDPLTSGASSSSNSASSDPGEMAARQELQSILKKAPIIIFSKSYCPYSRRAKQVLLHDYDIVPKPYIVELDQLTDRTPPTTMGRKIQDLLKSLTGRSTVPNIMIASQSLGGSDEIVDLHNQGKLADTIRRLAGKQYYYYKEEEYEGNKEEA
ncbi:hypothetical protein DV736_g309, partial [Chaetothyriales sp. CBS 134916]